MARKWSEVRKTLSPEAEERIRGEVKAAANVMALYQARHARRLTQDRTGQALKIDQGESAVPSSSSKPAN